MPPHNRKLRQEFSGPATSNRTNASRTVAGSAGTNARQSTGHPTGHFAPLKKRKQYAPEDQAFHKIRNCLNAPKGPLKTGQTPCHSSAKLLD